jgi:hypothetical protein
MTMNAQLLEERTVFKVAAPLRVERIGFRPNLDVTPDFGLGRINQPNPNGFAIRCLLARGCRKFPGSPPAELPVSAGNPTVRSARMPAFSPSPEDVPQNLFHFLEGLQRHNVAMVIHPATNDRIELTYQVNLTCSPVLTHQLAHLFQKVMRVLFGGADNQLAVKLAEVCPRKSNPCPMCVMQVFSGESCKPRSRRNCSTSGLTSFSSTALSAPVMMKSSA